MEAKTIALLGALDTKGVEYNFVKTYLEAQGYKTLIVDTGTFEPHGIAADISRDTVARRAGADLQELVAKKDRGAAVAAMTRGAAVLLPELYGEGRFDGVMALGGSGGTAMASTAMRALPLGVPKIIVSTVAGGDVSGYVGVSDIVLIPSIVDVSGINRISRSVLSHAAGAMIGMVNTVVPAGEDKPLIAASMFGNTTLAVESAKALLEAAGYEVLVFHATGTGGRTMESLVETGMITGVLDITTTEWADELVGGVLSAGPHRLEAAAKKGVPAIVVPGCLDMVNFWAPETIPAQFKDRLFYPHNPNVTLMRTTVEENRRLGAILAEKLNMSKGKVTVLLPLKGISMIDAPGEPYWLPEADAALFDTLKAGLRPDIPVIELDYNINDPAFAKRCADELLRNIGAVALTH